MCEASEFLESVEMQTDCFNFYNDLVQQVFKQDFETENFLKKVKSVGFYTFNKKEETYVAKSDMKFDDEVVRCAYILKYSVINSYCVFEHFQNVYNCDSSLFNQLKENNTAHICCFGGGAGTELFAICKVISDFLRNNSNEKHQYTIKLYFTIVDVCKEWENWAISLVKKLKKCVKDVIDVRMRFIQADLTKKWGEDVLKVVQKADILTMVKFISALNLSDVDYDRKKDLILLASVAHEIKLNSWIFFLDFAGGWYYKKMEDKMKRYQYFQQVQSFLHQKHAVETRYLKISKPLSSYMYQVMSINVATKVSSGTWQKCIPKVIEKRQRPNSVKKVLTAQILP